MRPLNVSCLSKSFGGLKAVENVSFTAQPGRILSIIGPNGAGKSTVLGMLAGMIPIDSGAVEAFGTNISRLPQERRVRMGISILRQHSSPLPNYTVAEYLALATIAGPNGSWDNRAQHIQAVAEKLELTPRLNARPRELTHGDLRRLEFARVLTLRPQIILLDEPFAGLAPPEVSVFEKLIRALADEGKTVVLVDHDVQAVRRLADEVVLMGLGRTIDVGSVEDVFRGEKIRDTYLGTPIHPRHRALRTDTTHAEALLEVESLRVEYGRLTAVDGVSFGVRSGEICSILGLNGAGKSSLMNAVVGFARYGGCVRLDGVPLEGTAAWDRVKSGIGYVPEERALFPSMTVRQHLQLSSESRRGSVSAMNAAFDLFPRLEERMEQRAGTLSGGEQQMLAIARALVRAPRCLLVDEPTLGLAPAVVSGIATALSDLAVRGTAILVTEQNVRFAGALADNYFVIRDGVFVTSGRGVDILEDPSLVHEIVGDLTDETNEASA